MQDRYSAWGIYDDPGDPRLIVPKRNPGMGWTINAGHPLGRASLVAIAGIAAAAILAALTR